MNVSSKAVIDEALDKSYSFHPLPRWPRFPIGDCKVLRFQRFLLPPLAYF